MANKMLLRQAAIRSLRRRGVFSSYGYAPHGFSTCEEGFGRETNSLLEEARFEPSVRRKPRPAFGYSRLIMKSLSASDSAPQPRLCDQQAAARWRSRWVEGTIPTVWAFPVKRLFWAVLTVFCSEREGPFFVSSPAIRFAEGRWRGDGPFLEVPHLMAPAIPLCEDRRGARHLGADRAPQTCIR